MTLWRFSDPRDFTFARASLRGSWSEAGTACEECGASSQRRVQPLVIEWEADSDTVGDFVWPGFGSDLAISDRVAVALEEKFTGFELGPVEMFQDPKLKRSKKSKPRVWLPYDGPELHDLWVTPSVAIDRERSTVMLASECATCGAQQYSVDGVEKVELGWDQELKQAMETHIPRSRNAGLFVRREDLRADIFRVIEFPAWILCTDEVKRVIEEQKYTNAGFLEVGEVFTDS